MNNQVLSTVRSHLNQATLGAGCPLTLHARRTLFTAFWSLQSLSASSAHYSSSPKCSSALLAPIFLSAPSTPSKFEPGSPLLEHGETQLQPREGLRGHMIDRNCPFRLFLSTIGALVVITFQGVSTPTTPSIHPSTFCSEAHQPIPIAF